MNTHTHAGIEVRPCIEDDAGSVTSGHEIADADAKFFGVYQVDAEGYSTHVSDYPTRDEAEKAAAIMNEDAAGNDYIPAAYEVSAYAEEEGEVFETTEDDAKFFRVHAVKDGVAENMRDFPTRAEAERFALFMAGKDARAEAYEARKEAKRERYAELAGKHHAAATASYGNARKIMDMIPFGQPILVGHHSEKRHRADIKRIDSGMASSVQHDKTAQYYEEKAENYGAHGIAANDPAAIDKLKAKLAAEEKRRADYTAINAYWRKHKTLDGCPELANDEKLANAIKKGMAQTNQWRGRTDSPPFPTYTLSYAGKEIARLKGRITQLENAAAAGEKEIEKDGYTYREDPEEMRIMLMFPGKPDSDTRDVLKSNGFRWSPRLGAWVRQLNNAGKWAAKRVMEKLDAPAVPMDAAAPASA